MRPDWMVVGRLQMDKTDRWVEYIEKLYQGAIYKALDQRVSPYRHRVFRGGLGK